MKYFPIFLDVEKQRVVIAGDAPAVLAKTRLLRKTSAEIHVYTNVAATALQPLAAKGAIHLHHTSPRREDLKNAALVYLGYQDVSVSRVIQAQCRELGVLCNTIDNAGASDFISAAIVDRDPVVVAIGSEGSAPVLVRQIKADIEALLGSATGTVALLAQRLRPVIRSRLRPADRRRFWRQFFAGDAETKVNTLGVDAARREFHSQLRDQNMSIQQKGRVALVGAGPGDPELLTRKACRLLAEADVVLYDRLVDSRIIDLARREATLIEVGKVAGGKSWKQNDINQEILKQVAAGHDVVRLKSGDPMIFGRADEELDVLDLHNIDYELVPGITAAASASASMRASLTRRARNSAFSLLTAQDVDGFAEHDWRNLARTGATSAIYMGVSAAPFVQRRLLQHGAAASTPIAIVENASREDERVLNGELHELDRLISTHHLKGPAVIFIGLHARASARNLITRPPAEHQQAAA